MKTTPVANVMLRMIIMTSNAVRYINYTDIVYLQAEDNYTMVYFRDGSNHLLCKTLKVIENDLKSNMFFRCHKSYLINVKYIKEIKRDSNLTFIILTDEMVVPVARRRWNELKSCLIENEELISNICTSD